MKRPLNSKANKPPRLKADTLEKHSIMKRTWPVLILIAALTLFSLMNTAPTLAQTETPYPDRNPHPAPAGYSRARF